MARYRFKLTPRVKNQGGRRRKGDATPDADLAKTWSERELADLAADDSPNPEDSEDLHYGCSGCMWAIMVFLAIMTLTVVLNRCAR